jgi:hypothetical protein
MKVLSTFLVLATVAQSSAFVVAPKSDVMMTFSRSFAVNMGLFDFFSEEAKQKREAQRQREIDEQERAQMEILERRENPKKMEEYEARVKVRRRLRMDGNDEAADSVKMYED